MKALPLALVISATVGLLAGCKEQAPASPPAQPPVPVSTTTVVGQDIPVTAAVLGELKNSAVVDLKSKVSGYIINKAVADGQAVKKGDLLFEIDPTDFALAVEKAKAQAQVTKASLDLTETEYTRIAGLYANKAVSKQEYDSASAARAIKASEYRSAQTAVKQAEQALSDTRIAAPFDGVVYEGRVNVGDMVQAQATNLITLGQMTPLWIEAGVSEDQYQKLLTEDRRKTLISFESGDKRISAPVIYESAEVDARLGTIKLRAEVDNVDYSLKPGSFARVTVTGRVMEAVAVVPKRAVIKAEQGHFVYVLKDGKAEMTPVQVGAWQGDQWVIESGLKAGDKVITTGLIKLRPGADVVEAGEGQPAAPTQVDGVAGTTRKGAK